MRTSQGDNGGGRAGRRGGGFTLIELLVVVAVISLLVGILVPVVQVAINRAEGVKTAARLAELGGGCYSFRQETGYYPGQADYDQLTGSSGTYTGSQVLAKCLFGGTYAELVNPGVAPPTSAEHAPVQAGDVDKFSSDGSTWAARHTPRMGTVLDRASEPMAVLYYPYRLNVTSGHYKYDDNAVYVEAHDVYVEYKALKEKDASYSTSQYHTDMVNYFNGSNVTSSSVDTARNAGGFILVAAGSDRVYFSGDDPMYPD